MKKRLNNSADIKARILELELENKLYLESIKTDLTDVKTYLPKPLQDGISMNSLSGAANQLENKGFKLGVLLPIILNNTLFRSKSKATKTLITSVSLLLDDNVSFDDIKKNVKKLFKKKKKRKKKKKKTKLVPTVIADKPVEVVNYSETKL